MYDIIKQIPIVQVMDKLWITYTKIGFDTLGLWDDGKLTDGRTIRISGNYVNDFSGKWRARGWPFTFVKGYLKLSDKETFRWFVDNFHLECQKKQNRSKKTETHKKEKYQNIQYHRNW